MQVLTDIVPQEPKWCLLLRLRVLRAHRQHIRKALRDRQHANASKTQSEPQQKILAELEQLNLDIVDYIGLAQAQLAALALIEDRAGPFFGMSFVF